MKFPIKVKKKKRKQKENEHKNWWASNKIRKKKCPCLGSVSSSASHCHGWLSYYCQLGSSRYHSHWVSLLPCPIAGCRCRLITVSQKKLTVAAAWLCMSSLFITLSPDSCFLLWPILSSPSAVWDKTFRWKTVL